MHKYGRGKVVARQSAVAQPWCSIETAPSCGQQQQQQQQPPSICSAVTRAAEPAPHKLGPWRCAATLESGMVPEVSCTAQTSTWSDTKALREQQPLCLRGLQLVPCRVVQNAEKFSAETHHKQPSAAGVSNAQQALSVLCSAESTNRFIEPDGTKNLLGSYYHIRKPETSTLQLSFPEFVLRSAVEQQHRLLLRADVCRWRIVHSDSGKQAVTQPNGAVFPHLHQLLGRPAKTAAHTSASQQLKQHQHQRQQALCMDDLVAWPALARLLEQGCWSQHGAMSIECGGQHALLPAQYHTQDRVLCQVSGRRRMLLVPPEQAFAGCYPYPVAHAYDTYSAVDFEEPEAQWPQATWLCGLVCELAPGDALVVPAFWFLHSELLQPRTVTLVLSLVPGPERCLSQGALELQLARIVELWAAAEVGTANVRHWLQVVGNGHELKHLQLETTEGYRRLRMCQRILRAAELVTGAWSISISNSSGSSDNAASTSSRSGINTMSTMHSSAEHVARHLLLSMCQGRLMPTDWLNENIMDPLYLRHQPEHYEIVEEDDEAARYPQLFRHKLAESRADWKEKAKHIVLGGSSGAATQLLQ